MRLTLIVDLDDLDLHCVARQLGIQGRAATPNEARRWALLTLDGELEELSRHSRALRRQQEAMSRQLALQGTQGTPPAQ